MDEAGKTGNLYWTVNKNKNTGTVDRMFGSAVISYKPVKGLTITNNLGTDFFEEQRRQIYAWGTVGLPDGQFNTNNITYRQINNDLMISYDTTFGKDWSFKAMLGHNINQNFTKYLDVTAKNLLVADIYSYANAESVITTNDQAKSRLIGVYGEIDLGYKDIVYLSVTGRNDWSSTMPKSHRSYFYPSVSAGFVFSQLIPQNNVLSFGKLRLSYANVGSDTVPYALDFLYTPESSIFLQYVGNNSIPHGGLLAYMAPATYPDLDAQPAPLDVVVASKPDIIGHNIETVERLTPVVRSKAKYRTSLETLRYLSAQGVATKSGLMVGLGESDDEVLQTLHDLRDAGVGIVTLGQYLRPTLEHYPVAAYITPEKFEWYRLKALEMGFSYCASAPLVRSSYMAEEALKSVKSL